MIVVFLHNEDRERKIRELEAKKLPYGWGKKTNKHGRVYYINHRKKSTTWTHPAITAYERHLAKRRRRNLKIPPAADFPQVEYVGAFFLMTGVVQTSLKLLTNPFASDEEVLGYPWYVSASSSFADSSMHVPHARPSSPHQR